ncbi:CPBP family intramembrane metalloprotease [Planosporangium flavigriseum]|uniref:CPBP family intramembrane glutamic endopeptidase n=1 Tax=Planosporangium flavigriseum TaxID=373681 RepID=UPI0014387B29|nr:CPBP family intramembrane glutamic endopeptidase [Planosporangium flavigriseum]NJC63414.1 CPBP family intramembrane metalloprotease [Planosporangium flavigriseum]
MIPPPVPGTPYHLLAVDSSRPWWRSLAITVAGGFLAVVAGLVVVCAVVVTGIATGRPAGRFQLPTFGDLGDSAWQLLVVGAVIPALAVAARAGQRRPAGTLASVCGRLRLPWLAVCLLVAIAAQLCYVGAETMMERDATELGRVGWPGFLVAVPVLLALVPLQVAGEEYLFRGWLLQGLSGLGRGPWIALVGSALLFAGVHGLGTVWGFLDLVAFALITGWLAVRTGGLEAAIAIHLATNLVAMIWQAATGNLASTETAADGSWRMTLVDVATVALYAAVISRLADRRGVAAVVPEPAARGYRRGGTGIRARSDATMTSPANSSAASSANRSGSV